MTKMAALHMGMHMVKHFTIFFSRNQWADFDETWHEESIIFCLNDNPWLILTYFTPRSNFAT